MQTSDSESDNESNGSIGTPLGPAPTPGHGLDRSASNSPNYNREGSPRRFSIRQSRSRSRSIGAVSNNSRSPSPVRSQRHGSANSRRSGSGRSGSPSPRRSPSRSASPVSRRSGSAASKRSDSPASNRSGSQQSAPRSQRSRSSSAGSKGSVSGGSQRSRSGSAASRRSRSGSAVSKRSRSGSAGSKRSRSGSAVSKRSRSGSAGSKRSRSGSAGSKRSRSGSAGSKRSRSGSAGSKRSRSGSAGSKRSRSGSAGSKRSRSGSAGSKRSRSGSRRSRSGSADSRGSGSGVSNKSRSRSPSKSRAGSHDRSGSDSPNLQIDEDVGSVKGDKRKRDTSEESDGKKKSKTVDSDSGNEGGGGGGEKEKVDAADIFGDADDISSEDEKDEAGSDREEGRRSRSDDGRRSRSEDEAEQRPTIEDEEDKENEPEPIPETRIDVKVPKITCDLGKDIHFVKLPNFLSVETRPFDPETYEDEIDEEETLDEEGRARLKLKVENTMRWRETVETDGSIKKESNARFVRWSDGSYSLHLGSEIFDVYKQPLQGDHNHLFIRQGTGLQGQAVFRTKLSFRPHSTESFTHRKMTLSLADRSTKTSGIKIMSQVGVDPDLDKATRLKKEEEKLRQTPVKHKSSRKKNDGGGSRSHGVSFLREEEGSEDEGAISLNAIKNKYKSGKSAEVSVKGGAIYSSDEDGSDIESSRHKQKSKLVSDDESESD